VDGLGGDDDFGLFGPDSVSWRVHAEPLLWLAALRALYLQMLEPRAIAGVVQNSRFQEDPWGRLFRTAQFFGVVIYGRTPEARAAGERLRGIHARMRATDPATGEAFRIDEPHLLRWIHTTATESFLSTVQRAGMGLSPAEADRYYDEQRSVAELVGLDPATVPGSAAEVEAYYAEMRPHLSVSPDARETARYLALPHFPYRLGLTPVRPLWILVAGYGFSLLPRWARRLYGLPGLPTTDLSASLTARTIRRALRTMPTTWYEGPLYHDALARAERLRSAGRNPGDTATMPSARTAGTANARRRLTLSANRPMMPAPNTKPA